MYLCCGHSTELSRRLCTDRESMACLYRAGSRWRPLPVSIRIMRYAMSWQAPCMPILSDHRLRVEESRIRHATRRNVAPIRRERRGEVVGPLVVSGGERGGKGGGIQIFHVQVSTIHGTHLRPCFAALPAGEEPVAPPHAAEAARRAKDDYEA